MRQRGSPFMAYIRLYRGKQGLHFVWASSAWVGNAAFVCQICVVTLAICIHQCTCTSSRTCMCVYTSESIV